MHTKPGGSDPSKKFVGAEKIVAKSLTRKLGLGLILLISEGVFWECSWMLISELFDRAAN